ncbi:uroporphyrinogen-III decarboxylase [Moorella thermoacetica Y72]|uniref:Uroporphyrinogen-III decarboxylase n=1 Tax=Moorella thermoacetica Y72 TaxID=1325331 RepID=A0A0S6UAW3_NEOTH|nr:uroporphyrinogen decarboxylase family protein [Moorella thermoacetica]GAF25325.1 uroporphyrinogen-III decarboxylase [Moorella thermoacetica Y72]
MLRKERLLTALKHQQPDRVPFVDYVDAEIREVFAGKKDYQQWEVAQALNMDGVFYEILPPVFAHIKNVGGRKMISEGLIKTPDDITKLQEYLPDPSKASFYDEAKKFLDENGPSGLALIARQRMGAAPTILSLGVETFSYLLFDNPMVIENTLEIYCNWSIEVINHLSRLGFDVFWFYDDIAFNSAPFFSPQTFKQIFLPRLKRVAECVQLPWVFHSDGNLLPILDDLLSLGMNALHPIQPEAMDIEEVAELYGESVCIIGNIDVNLLCTGTPEQVEELVKFRIEKLRHNKGGYILSSSNSIPGFCKPENALAIGRAIERYGYY